MSDPLYLLDTNVVSELRKKQPSPRVAAWCEPLDAGDFYLSTVTLMEIVSGIETVRRKDEAFADILDSWLTRVKNVTFRGRFLVVTPDIAEAAGRILAMRSRNEADAIIAATALVHGFVLVTRNTADFDDTGVRMVNPWSE